MAEGYKSHFVCINPVVMVGNNLKAGQEIYCYEEEDENGRPIMHVYLDGMPRDAKREIETVAYNTFLEKQSEILKKVKKAKWRRPSVGV